MQRLWDNTSDRRRATIIKYLLSSPNVSLTLEYALKRCKIQKLPWDELPENVKIGVASILRMFWAGRIVTAYK